MTKNCGKQNQTGIIRRAAKIDLEQIMRIISDTVQGMNAEGNDQWNEEYPRAEHFERDIENKRLFVLEENSALLGLICLDENGAPGYERIRWAAEGNAFVIHRFAVSPAARAKGIGTCLMNFAEQDALKNGAARVITDTYSLNKKAISLFENRGYRRRGELFFRGKPNPFYVYEKLL